MDVLRRYKNIEMMNEEDAVQLIGEINQYAALHDSIDEEKDTKNLLFETFSKELYTAERHGLDYRKLYHDFEGGYDIEKLTKVLERIKSDHK